MKKIAIIAGISGQDGSYLAEYLIKKKFQIIGLTRKFIFGKNIKHLKKKITLVRTKYSKIEIDKIINKYKPKLIFNLAGQTSPDLSWAKPSETIYSIVDINLNFINSIYYLSKKTKYFNASSSEIFLNSKKKINEESRIFPSNPYGCAKACSHFLVNCYRKKYNLFLVNGILFNHDSVRRGEQFLGKKIVKNSVLIKKNKKNFLKLNSLKPVRDFGYAKDYVEAMYLIMCLKKPDDFIIASGKSYSVRSYVLEVFKLLNISKKKIKSRNVFDTSLKKEIGASIKKIKKFTNWKPEYTFKKMIKNFVNEEKLIQNKKIL
jgi:GDPmannose 4,6-dehydratase